VRRRGRRRAWRRPQRRRLPSVVSRPATVRSVIRRASNLVAASAFQGSACVHENQRYGKLAGKSPSARSGPCPRQPGNRVRRSCAPSGRARSALRNRRRPLTPLGRSGPGRPSRLRQLRHRTSLGPGSPKYPQASPQAVAKPVEMWTICCAQNARFSRREVLSPPGRRDRLLLHRARSASRSKQLPRAVGGSRRFTGDVDKSATGSVNFFGPVFGACSTNG
jgi:hypothetical protein